MNKKRTTVLITGASGFSAKYLVQLLLRKKGLQLNYTDLKSKNEKNWHKCNLSDFKSVLAIVQRIRPRQIYHLAGAFSNNYDADYKANVVTAKNILDGILAAEIKCKVLLIGSAAEYGDVPVSANPVSEDYVLRPASIYGLTKVYQTYLMRYYFSRFNMDIVMARTFNLFGKGISDKLFIGSLYTQINGYKKGRIPKIILGNLNSKRDYIDASEAVKYYESIMNYGIPGEVYNVGSGKSIRCYDLMQAVLQENGLSMDSVMCKADAENRFKLDVSDIYADVKKISMLKKGHRNA